MRVWIFALIVSFCSLEAGPFVKVTSREHGMFSVFQDVLYALHLYEQGQFQGVVVDFENHGLYYDRAVGPNWWTYYFEPLCVGSAVGTDVRQMIPDDYYLFGHSREQTARLLNQYVRIKPHVAEKIDRFVQANFQDAFVIDVGHISW